MVLSIKDKEADEMARALAAATGETLTTAVAIAVRERLERVSGAVHANDLETELNAIALRAASLPVLDDRSADDIIGYDEHGLPV